MAKLKAKGDVAVKTLNDGAPGSPGAPGTPGIAGYTLISCGVHNPYPGINYRWDDARRDFVYRLVGRGVECYVVARRGIVPNGTAITNTTWWQRNDELIPQIPVNNLIGDIPSSQTRSIISIVDTETKYDNLIRAFSGGSNSTYNWDLNTNVIFTTYQNVRILLPHPSAFASKKLTIIRQISFGQSVPASRRGFFYVYQNGSSYSITITATREVGASSHSSDYSGYYKCTLNFEEGELPALDNGGTAIFEFYSNGDAWFWSNSREMSAGSKLSGYQQEQVAEVIEKCEGSMAMSVWLYGLRIPRSYITSSTFTRQASHLWIEFAGQGRTNTMTIPSTTPEGTMFWVQNNAVSSISISGKTVATSLTVIPPRTVCMLRCTAPNAVLIIRETELDVNYATAGRS